MEDDKKYKEFLIFAEKAIGDWLDIMDSLGYLDLLGGENKYEDVLKEWKNQDKTETL